MKTARNGAVELVYETDGPPQTETVVFVEDLGDGAWSWGWQQPAVAAGFETIVWDTRGTGRSDAPPGPYSVADMAADLEAVLADHGARRAHVVGAGLGGMVALQYALTYRRAKTLTLLCTSPGGDRAVETPSEAAELLFGRPEGLDEREVLRRRLALECSPAFVEERPDAIETIVDWRLDGDADEAGRAAQAAAFEAFDVSGELFEITIPALVMHGTADRVVPVENGRSLADGLPRGELIEYDDGSHRFSVEQSRLVNDDLVGFLESNAEER